MGTSISRVGNAEFEVRNVSLLFIKADNQVSTGYMNRLMVRKNQPVIVALQEFVGTPEIEKVLETMDKPENERFKKL